MCGGCTTAIQCKSTHQLCASQRAAENGDGDCRGWSAVVYPTMLPLMVGGGGVRAQTTLAEASVGGGSVTGAASGGGRDAQSLHNDVMAELRLVVGAAL